MMADKTPWYEDEQLWKVMEKRVFSESRVEMAPEEVEQLIGLTGVAPGSTILDLCCGVGRHSLEFARRGFKVTAVDRTERYLTRAQAAAEKAGLDIEFVKSDMRDFKRPGAFDLAINIFTSFGYFEDPAEDVRVIENMSESLKAGGCFAIETVGGKEILARIYQARDWDEEEDGTLFLQRRQIMQDWSWMQNQWILIKGTERHEIDFSHRVFSAVEMKLLLTQNGFESATAYGGLDGSDYDNEAKRLLVLGRK